MIKTATYGKGTKEMKKTLLPLGVMALFFVLTASAYALPVGGLIRTDGIGTLLSDNSADLVINGIGSDPTIVDVGDIMITVVGINTIEGVAANTIGSGTLYNELTAFSAVKITDGGALSFPNPQGLLISAYEASALTAADAWAVDWSTGTILGGALTFTSQAGLSNDGQVFGIMYEDAAKNYTREVGLQASLNSATDGTFRLLLGLVPANNDYLQTLAPVSLVALAAFSAANPSTNINFSNISLDGTILAQNWPGLNIFTNITGGNGGFSTTTVGSGWNAFDNLDFTIQATAVPEPSTIALLGLGLLGAGICSRIRRK